MTLATRLAKLERQETPSESVGIAIVDADTPAGWVKVDGTLIKQDEFERSYTHKFVITRRDDTVQEKKP